ncbi:MAG: hydrogenase maturation nickel metallochaperone HypA [Campylobacter gracilis]|uniref:hydrogenase maturation nickel metallochaperone HypA/HybF n=1 Tax=Campylobacter gracilis TaxID=824 RepID=UPI0026EB437B|nr:hydrogenase maturation nickel metallochaperone HypA [Campylobacter gracilis]MBS6152083.1 hydrogenase maturation nickel metallochaperone HypA [Campylobacter gracilis]
MHELSIVADLVALCEKALNAEKAKKKGAAEQGDKNRCDIADDTANENTDSANTDIGTEYTENTGATNTNSNGKNGDFYKNLDANPQASYDAFGSKSPQIRKLHVKIGRLSGVEAHYLQNCYEVFRAGTVCENADLIIHTQEIVVKCKNCGFSGDLTQNDFSCPRCKSSEISVIDGEDMYLMRLVIE